MPTANTRITITPTSEAHADLLTNWAILEGRTLSSLCSNLLENAINGAISKGTVNPQALEMMNELINVRRNKLKFEYGKTLTLEKEKAENYLDEIKSEASVDPEYEKKFQEWTSKAEEVWNKNSKTEEKNNVVQEPDLENITGCLKKLKLYGGYELDALKILTDASMAGIDIEKISDNVNTLDINTDAGKVDALKNFCNSFLLSKGLPKTKTSNDIELY